MIPLTKLAEPAILSANSAAWTAVVVNKIAAGQKPTEAEKTRYAHPDIKDCLRMETHQKCAYCESKFAHVAPGHIEHVTPKSVTPALWFTWDNLTLACPECNRLKGSTVGPFVDPYAVNPSDHLTFHGPTVWAENGSASGTFTEIELDLNRADLFQMRAARLKGLLRQVDNIVREADPAVKSALRKDLDRELSDDQEYAGMARDLIKSLTLKGVL